MLLETATCLLLSARRSAASLLHPLPQSFVSFILCLWEIPQCSHSYRSDLLCDFLLGLHTLKFALVANAKKAELANKPEHIQSNIDKSAAG